MKKLLILFTFLILFADGFAKDKNTIIYPSGVSEYEIEGDVVPSGGITTVKVTILTNKKDKIHDDVFMKAAIHGILFKGYAENFSQFGGETNQFKPLVGGMNGELDNLDFFKNFFNEMRYKYYIQKVYPRKVVKAGKNYKISTEVSVSVDELRKYLEENKIIRGLNSGW